MVQSIQNRVADIAWERVFAQLSESGYAPTGPLLNLEQCAGLTRFFRKKNRFAAMS